MTKAEAGRLGGKVRGEQKAIAAALNARKARDEQRRKNGALFGVVIPMELRPRQERPKTDWSRFEAFRQAIMD
jgi:hypothetical protein